MGRLLFLTGPAPPRTLTRLAYLDESQRKGSYALAAVAVDHRQIVNVRRQLRKSAPRGGSSRRHFVKESERDKKQLLDVFRVLPGAASCVYVVSGHGRPVDQRAEALEGLVRFLVAGGLDRIVLDHVDHTQQRRDRQTLAKVLRQLDVSYGFEPPQSSEPLLWVPDAIAWCVGRAEWRHHLDGWVEIAG